MKPSPTVLRALIPCMLVLACTCIAPKSAADPHADPRISVDAGQDSVIVSGGVSYDVVVSVPGASGGGGVVADSGVGGVFDAKAAFMASLSYAMCFGMRMGVNVGMRAIVLDPDECATDAA
uniref:hypothetical protein n=1 Tax=Actinomyces qiguomingii TaxID=2057800 RepID=UPI001E34F75E